MVMKDFQPAWNSLFSIYLCTACVDLGTKYEGFYGFVSNVIAIF